MALEVRCTAGHISEKLSAEAWRYDRRCGVDVFDPDVDYAEPCGEPTVVQYRTNCNHPAWRYPNPMPVDGDICPVCRSTYYEPYLQQISEGQLESARSWFMALAFIIEEALGLNSARHTTDTLRAIFATQGWDWHK